MKLQDYIRIALSLVLIVLVWMGYKWALYLCVTLSFIANELTGWVFKLIAKEMKK